MQLRGFIFDLDGTVGDTLPVCFVAFRQVFQQYLGQTFTDRQIRAMFGPSEEGMLEQMVPDRWQESVEAYLAAYEQAHVECSEPFPGMKDALEKLRGHGVRLAIVTGKGPRSAAISLRAMGLSDDFEMVVAGSANGNRKPRNMQQVLSTWGLQASQVAALGDAPSDIRAARQIGALPLAAAWAATAKVEELESLQPHVVFHTVNEFIHWIDETLV
jgi:HAD superfamily hydrolase (TIGR01509 family)